jgi:hypothetical protein
MSPRYEKEIRHRSNRFVATRALAAVLPVVGLLVATQVDLPSGAGATVVLGLLFSGAFGGRYVGEAWLRLRLWWHYRGME